jgi:hypothetical protein
MMSVTKHQQEYANSIVGPLHCSAFEIIGKLDAEIDTLKTAVAQRDSLMEDMQKEGAAARAQLAGDLLHLLGKTQSEFNVNYFGAPDDGKEGYGWDQYKEGKI